MIPSGTIDTEENETIDSSLTVDRLKQVASGRALNRRNFMTALGAAGAASAALMSSRQERRPSVVEAAAPSQTDVLNFALNLEYLEATFYSYITQGVDLPASVTTSSGPITGAPTAKLVFTGSNAAQITDLLNEIYYDELNHVIDLRSVLGSVAVNRPALNLAAYAAITATNALTIARVFEDVGVTAYAGAAALLSGTNLTYAAQILAVEGFHAGALRLIALQNPTIAAYAPPIAPTFTANVTAGSNIITGFPVTVGSTIGVALGNYIVGAGIPVNATITAFAVANSAVAPAVVGTITISSPATITGTAVPITLYDAQDVRIYDPGSVATASLGPTAGATATVGGFFATSGPNTANGQTPAGLAFTRTTSQVLSIVYAAAGVPPISAYGTVGVPVSSSSKGGFFPNGMNGLINTI